MVSPAVEAALTAHTKLRAAERRALVGPTETYSHDPDGLVVDARGQAFHGLVKHGLIDHSCRLTTGGKVLRKVLADGYPFSERPAPRRAKFPNVGKPFLEGTSDAAGTWFSDGNCACKGNLPTGFEATRTVDSYIEIIVGHANPVDAVQVWPVAVTENERFTLVYFGSGAAMDARYYDFIDAHYRPARWVQNDGDNKLPLVAQTDGDSPATGRPQALVMPVLVERLTYRVARMIAAWRRGQADAAKEAK